MTDFPDIVDRCLAASADDRLSSGQLYREAAEEIKLLRLAIARIAEQDATLSVCNGNVAVTMDATLTDAEREALERAWDTLRCLQADYGKTQTEQDAHTLRGLLERSSDGR